jgi:hypothetical protein
MSFSERVDHILCVKLESSTDPDVADDFLVRLDTEQKTCEILCARPYSKRTDKVLREFYDLLVERYVRLYANFEDRN